MSESLPHAVLSALQDLESRRLQLAKRREQLEALRALRTQVCVGSQPR
jgi:hypothetical protein